MLFEIEKQCFSCEAFSKQQIAYLLADYNAVGLEARVGEELVGFVIGRIDVNRTMPFGHIITLDVLPAYRRRGIAKQLMRSIEAVFHERGIKECRLEVREDNEAALGLYHKLGYDQIGKMESYYGNGNGLYLKKPLG